MNADIKYIKGNIFTSRCQTLVNTVNCVGIMGAGIALEFKYRYPEMFEKYVQHCKDHLIKIGKIWIYDIPDTKRKVLNLPTKNDWKHPSKYEYLQQGLERFVSTYRDKNIISIAFPLLGAQNGGLDPEKVKDLMFEYLQKCDIPVEIYEYSPTAHDDLIDVFTNEILYSPKEFQKITRISPAIIYKLKVALAENALHTLIQLTKIKGIGEETIKQCFQFAIQYKKTLISEPNNFPEPALTTPGKGTSDTGVMSNGQDIHTDNIPDTIAINDTHDATGNIDNTPSAITETQPLVRLVPQVPTEKILEPSLPTPESPKTSPKKPGAKAKKSKSPKVYTMGEKQLLTYLPESIILKIEDKNEGVTIQDIRAYCTGLKLNFKTFLATQYASPASALQP